MAIILIKTTQKCYSESKKGTVTVFNNFPSDLYIDEFSKIKKRL